MESLEDIARWRRAETLLGLGWYAFSAFVLFAMTSSSSALTASRGLEVWGAWVGRFAVLPAIATLGGLAFVLRHQWQARGQVDALIAPRVPRIEPVVVFSSVLIVATFGWILRPVLDPVMFCIAILLFCAPLIWVGIRAPSRSTRWVWAVTGFSLASAGVLGWLEIQYGPMAEASDAALYAIVRGVLLLAGIGLTLAISLLAVVLVGFIRADRAFDRGELDAVSALSFGGLLEDNPLVLQSLRLIGQPDEAEARYHRLVAALPLAGPLHVLAHIYADRGDARAVDLARAAVHAFPLSPSSLLAYARVLRRTDPEAAMHAVVAAQTRGIGGASRTPVFEALEVCILAHLGQHAAARRKLADLDFGDHPVHHEEARLFAAEAHHLLGDDDAARAALDGIEAVPSYVERATVLRTELALDDALEPAV